MADSWSYIGKVGLFQFLKMKGASEETKMVLAAVDAGLKKLHTLDDSITLYEVVNVSWISL